MISPLIKTFMFVHIGTADLHYISDIWSCIIKLGVYATHSSFIQTAENISKMLKC